MDDNQPGARSLGVSMAAPFVAAAIGSAATRRSNGAWYESLDKPDWNPPRRVFGPVWTALYLAMGLASWLVWRDRAASRQAGHADLASLDATRDQEAGRGGHGLALGLYGTQLVLNALWSVHFFGTRRPRLAFVEVIALWGAILATLVSFARVRGLAGALLVPYLAWTTYATALNEAI